MANTLTPHEHPAWVTPDVSGVDWDTNPVDLVGDLVDMHVAANADVRGVFDDEALAAACVWAESQIGPKG